MRARAFLAAAMALLALTGCHDDPGEFSVLRIVDRAQDPNPNAGLSVEAHLGGVPRVDAAGLADGPRFQVVAQTGLIQKYPCSSCHTLPLAEMRPEAGPARQAHWDIRLEHAPAAIMTCATCHALDEPDSLHTLRGAPVTYDHSDRVCAQCHARAAAEWAGGAHGKRVGGWAPPRVVLGCPACHDPHQPRWDVRWPAVTGGTRR